MPKTTIEIPAALLADAKRVARERGTTLRELVNAGLRDQLAERSAHSGRGWEPLTFEGRTRPEIDLRDWGQIKEILREDRR